MSGGYPPLVRPGRRTLPGPHGPVAGARVASGTVPPPRRSLAPLMRLIALLAAAAFIFFVVVRPSRVPDDVDDPNVLLQRGQKALGATGLRRTRTPFDIVYMWVNGTETTYAANRAKHKGLARVGDRDRDNGELRFSMRSLDKYMPWFTGTVHFVHQNLPCWLDVDHPRLNLVHHRQIFTDVGKTLPTFSSDSIEAHLHRIPGLQKHFLLMNDDFFLGRMTSMSDYVLSNGDPVLWFEKYTVKGTKKDHLDLMKKGKKSWLSKIYHSKSVLVDHFGVTNPARYHFLKHSPTMLDRDRMYTLWDKFPEPITKTVHYRHRRPDGLSMTWLHHHYCLLDPGSRCFVVPQALSDKEAKFIKVGSTATETVRKTLHGWLPSTGHPPKFFTINDETDVGRGKHEEGRKLAYDWFLPTVFPTPSQWETRSTCVPIPRVTAEAKALASQR